MFVILPVLRLLPKRIIIFRMSDQGTKFPLLQKLCQPPVFPVKTFQILLACTNSCLGFHKTCPEPGRLRQALCFFSLGFWQVCPFTIRQHIPFVYRPAAINSKFPLLLPKWSQRLLYSRFFFQPLFQFFLNLDTPQSNTPFQNVCLCLRSLRTFQIKTVLLLGIL